MGNDTTTNWWEAAKLRRELLDASGQIADVQMSLRGVAYGIGNPLYRDVDYFGEITHPSPSLIRVAADIAVRLGGHGGQATSARPVWRFDQGMGGGKSHALVALYHLATDPGGFAQTDVGKLIIEEAQKKLGSGKLSDDLGRPIVIALPGDQMSPGKPDPNLFGGATTLWERFLFRLYEGDHDRWVADKDSISYDAALRSVGRPVLILFDEVMHYVRASTAAGPTEAAIRDQEFLVKIMRDTNEVDHCVAVMVMIDSDKDPIALSDFGETCRRELEEEAERGEVRGDAVTSPNDFASIIRRRLFEQLPSQEEIAQTAEILEAAMRDAAWRREVFAKIRLSADGNFTDQVGRAYPFHPALIQLAEQEWSQVAGFQRVRSTIRVFAATVYAHLRRLAEADGISVEQLQENPARLSGNTWAPDLIGPGDIVLSDPDVREALLDSGLILEDKTAQNYRQVITTDIADEDDRSGNARKIDLEAAGNPARARNPRAAERLATASLLYSINDRPQGGQGASVPEALAATFVSDLSYGFGDAEVVLEAVKDPKVGLASLEQIPGKGGQPPRLFLSTKKTFGMFFRDALNAVSDEERSQAVADRAKKLASSGPFEIIHVDRHDGGGAYDTIRAASIDKARRNRLVILDPSVFTLLNGDDGETRSAIRAAMGLGEDKLAVNWASSCVFAVVNTYRRRNALIAAGEYLAAKRVASRDTIKSDADLLDQAEAELKAKEAEFDKQVKAAFQHVVWLSDVGDNKRDWADHRFEGDLETALNGTHVWKLLQDRDKAYGQGEFTGAALIHSLREHDFGKPLSELRDDFWRVPRLSLLPHGEQDLKSAIWTALNAGEVRIVTGSGEPVEAHSANDINLSSDALRLALPGDPTDEHEDTGEGNGGDEGAGPVSEDGGSPPGEDRQVSVAGTLVVNASNQEALRVALDAIRNAVDDGDVTFMQISIKATMAPDQAERVREQALAANLASQTQDL